MGESLKIFLTEQTHEKQSTIRKPQMHLAKILQPCENSKIHFAGFAKNFATPNLPSKNFVNQLCLVKSQAKFENPMQTHFACPKCFAKFERVCEPISQPCKFQ